MLSWGYIKLPSNLAAGITVLKVHDSCMCVENDHLFRRPERSVKTVSGH
jgi:hypothetical protein